MAVLDVQFPPKISHGAQGGPGMRTDVVVLNSGFEQRNAVWSVPRSRYDVSHGVKSQTDLDTLIAFFRVADGRLNSFRFKDWLDYLVTVSNGRLGITAIGTGFPTYQLYKRYNNAAASKDRLIAKPVSDQVTAYRNAGALTMGSGAGNIAIDYTTGIITFVADSSKAITGITKANPGVITTSTPHGFSTGDLIYLSGIGGMTELNGTVVTITSTGASTFSIGVNTTSYGTYTSGGTAAKYPQAADALTWAGQFDVPARFDIDEMKAVVDDYGIYSWGGIPVVEIRV